MILRGWSFKLSKKLGSLEKHVQYETNPYQDDVSTFCHLFCRELPTMTAFTFIIRFHSNEILYKCNARIEVLHSVTCIVIYTSSRRQRLRISKLCQASTILHYMTLIHRLSSPWQIWSRQSFHQLETQSLLKTLHGRAAYEVPTNASNNTLIFEHCVRLRRFRP